MKSLLLIFVILISELPFSCKEKAKYLLTVSVYNHPEQHERFQMNWSTTQSGRRVSFQTPMFFDLKEIPVVISLYAEHKMTILKVEVKKITQEEVKTMFWNASHSGTVFILSDKSMGIFPHE